jgi:hypothetical protein
MTRPEEVVLRGRRPHAVLVAGLLIAVVVVGGAAAAQNEPPPAKTSFHVESSPRVFAGAPAREGSVHNAGPLRPRNVRLEVEALDADGTVIEEALGSVLGGLDPSRCAYLIVCFKRTGSSYRMSVLLFDSDADYGSRS